MPEVGTTCRSVLVVDDDVVMRELLTVLLGMEGYEVQVAESGDEALMMLANGTEANVILVDLHMPGVHGLELAVRLNAARAAETLLIGMSGSKLKAEEAELFGAFLKKPFTAEDFTATVEAAKARIGGTIAGGSVERAAAAEGAILDDRIFERLRAMLPPAQLRELYRITIKDVSQRIALMRESAQLGKAEETRREAHAIKGGCGMVGASELSRLAAQIEGGSDPGNPPFADFDAACSRLQDMLDARF